MPNLGINFNFSEIYPYLNLFGDFLKNWWWLPLPLYLWRPLVFLYLWSRIEFFLSQQKSVILEVKMPKEILKPVRAMEQVMASIHGACTQPPDLWEKWIDGQVQLSIYFEIVSTGGATHFFIRMPVGYRDPVEASIYSQYPEVELIETDDYTKYVPQDIPNKEWDLFGTDYIMIKDDHYPIKTYKQFETEREALEEKRVDPISVLVEAMAKVKQDEHFWIQIAVDPVSDADIPHSLTKWLKAGAAVRDKLARRQEAPKSKPFLQETAEILITGKVPEPVKIEKDLIPPEMKLTPGEREIITGLEEKMSKQIFQCGIRFIYIGKRESWFKGNFRLAFAYFNGYTTSNLNSIQPTGQTLTKVKKSFFFPKNWIRPRRHYLKCRKLFRNYTKRLGPLFPRPGGKLNFMMNIEELASLFHFPGQAIASTPFMERVEAKKGEAPSRLPTE